MSDHINVMIVDDQAETRLGFALVLRRDPSLRLWGQAGDGKQAVDAVDRAAEAGRTLPDVVLMDVRMPVMDGIDACARICERHPEVRVLILTTYDEDDYAFGGLEAGAVLTPRITRAVLVVNVPKVVSGSERERLRRAFRQLTDHEREICSLIADGLSNGEIAELLVIQPASAKRAVSRILSKLGMRDRTQIAVSWYRAGL